MRASAASLDRPIGFGDRYTLVRRLAVGGMAEIYLARQAAMAGFEKEVVIKCLRPELVDDNRIVEMFLDEARIGALLNHPNIVHVYDVDSHDDIPYIAMEYIVGEELNELCRRGLTHGKFLPLPHAVELIRQAAAGMGYFHAKRSSPDSALEGAPLDIVHCDISPSNLLVTEDGFLKLIDFGIPKARGQRFRSESVIPGKLSYMSPEQAARQPVDHRSDIFSLGIVLYEITVGKRLFRGNAAEVVARQRFLDETDAVLLRLRSAVVLGRDDGDAARRHADVTQDQRQDALADAAKADDDDATRKVDMDLVLAHRHVPQLVNSAAQE